MHRRPVQFAVLLVVLVAMGAPAAAQAQQPAVPLARDAAAVRIIDDALRSVAARQRESGLFDDRTGRAVGAEGLPSLAYVALARAREDGQDPARPAQTLLRPSAVTAVSVAIADAASGGGAGGDPSDLRTAAAEEPDPGSWRLTLARRTLARGSGETVLLRWPLAMTLADGLEDLLVGDRGALRARARTWGRLHAAGIASDRCYQDPGCFNNYKLADAVLNLELVRTGLRSTQRRARLRDAARLRRTTIDFLAHHLPRSAPPSGRVRIPGRRTEVAAILSDPGTQPLAYATLCTAWVVRAARLTRSAAPPELRSLARRTLWGLLGAAGPDGDLSWSGRGQGQAWTHAAALYAASGGAALFAGSDPLLAARLRRLADIELDALGARMPDGELQILPSGNTELAGLDHYYSVTGSTGLALTFLQMARRELPDPDASRLAIPAEIDGATFQDPVTPGGPATQTGLLTRRSGLSWLAIRMVRDHPYDPRSDAGLVRAERLLGGRWREQLPMRPAPVSARGTPAQRTPSGGPVLVTGTRHHQPRAFGVRALAGGVDLHGVWQPAAGAAVAGAWRYTAEPDGVRLRSACPAGAALELTVWLPRRGVLLRDGGLVQRAGYAVRVSPRPKVRALATNYANSVQPSLRAYRIVIACTGTPATVTWSGGATTPAAPDQGAPGAGAARR